MTKITKKYIEERLKSNNGEWLLNSYDISISNFNDSYIVSLISYSVTSVAIERFKKCFPNAEFVGVGKNKVTNDLSCDFIFY